MAKSSQRQFLVSVNGVTGFFAKKSGGATSASVQKAYDGGNPDPDLLPGVREHSDLTVSRPFDPLRDQPVVKSMRAQVGIVNSTVTVQPCDANYQPVAEPDRYTGMLTEVTPSDVDASSSTPAEFSLKFAVAKVD